MSTSPNSLANTLAWFQAALPNPQEINVHTQIGVHFEEVGEMLECLTGLDAETTFLLRDAYDRMVALAKHLKGSTDKILIHDFDRVDFLDALCDQIVTATGVAHNAKFDLIGGLNEVNRSNFSKFVDGQPVFDDNNKIAKGPAYFKADLTEFAA